MNVKSLKAATVAAAAFAALGMTTSASAQLFPDFKFNPAAIPGVVGSSEFSADQIIGGYTEYFQLTPTSAAGGTFTVNILWNASEFQIESQVGSILGTGINNSYQMYATFTGAGSYTTGAGFPTFTLDPAQASALNVYVSLIGAGLTTTITGNDATGTFNFGQNGDDTLVATGAALGGFGAILSLPPCPSNNCGSFGQTTTFTPVGAVGTALFSEPVPFYSMSIQTGQLQTYIDTSQTGAPNKITGSINASFGRVPEPASLALVGLALAGVGLARRKKA